MLQQEEEEEDEIFCLGSACFHRPYPTYVPPPYHCRLPHKNYKWKVEARVGTGAVPWLRLERAFVLPNCLGLGDEGRWRWKWLPISFLIGLDAKSSMRKGHGGSTSFSPRLLPYVRLKTLTPLLGKLALQPSLECSADLVAQIRREFSLGQAKFAVGATLKAENCLKPFTEGVQWAVQLRWYSSKTDIVQSTLENNALAMEYCWKQRLSQSCRFLVCATTVVPRSLEYWTPQRALFEGTGYGLVRVTQKIGLKASRDEPLPTSTYRKALEGFGASKTISVTPGHWIDPGSQIGAAGEREFNLEVANVIEKKMYGHGWKVLRPDRDAPYLSWEEYLNWVSEQTQKGHPVVEIHGQGSKADYRGHVYGILGDAGIPLHKELAKEFGVFDMDWTGLGVPRRGGVIVESFNSDEVMQMNQQERFHAVADIANRIVGCIVRGYCGKQTTTAA